MPSAKKHEEEYRHNKNFAMQLESDPNYSYWSVTVIFYAAVHLMDRILSLANTREGEIVPGRKADPEKHYERRESLKLVKKLPEAVLTTYLMLEAQSRKHRYHCWKPNDIGKEISKANKCLGCIEDFALKY